MAMYICISFLHWVHEGRQKHQELINIFCLVTGDNYDFVSYKLKNLTYIVGVKVLCFNKQQPQTEIC